MNGRAGHMQRLLVVLALAAESGQADVEAFIDDIELQDLVVLIANLADLALRGISQPDADLSGGPPCAPGCGPNSPSR
ncbi:hypothetical protein [Streptomyces carpinensis]|uniref:Uncharacterized protein n=1 Tax=Streptomyces carpinensis TaxID=66369 RepID=A0ABV1VVP0_9ACTN|nr:hypothetical protein [Streptomyces carpinensis]